MLRPFYSKDGRLIIPRPHIASFNGKSNHNKSIVLIFLAWRKSRGETTGLSAVEISESTGLDLYSLRASLGKWYKWRYVDRRASSADGDRLHYVYSIGDRGRHFVENRIPPDRLNDYVLELNTHLNKGLFLKKYPGPME